MPTDSQERMRAIIDQRGWSIRKVSMLSGVSRGVVSDYITGDTKDMTCQNMVAICAALDVPLDWVLGVDRGPGKITPQEEMLLNLYRTLPSVGQGLAFDMMRTIKDSGKG